MKPCRFLVLMILVAVVAGCNEYGEKITIDNTDIYYLEPVSRQDAERLGKFLVAEEFIDGNPKTVQVRRQQGTYQFRMVIKEGLQADQGILHHAAVFCNQLSRQVFGGATVEIHLCDNQLETLRVVTDKELGEVREVNQTELYATRRITPEEAQRLMDYLVAQGFVDGSPKTTQIDRKEDLYLFRMVTHKGLENNEDTVQLMAVFAAELSRNVFDDNPVELHMCDDSLITLRAVPMQGFGTRIEIEQSEVYYTPAITEKEARKLVDYLVAAGALQGRDITIQLHREDAVYQFRMVVVEGAQNNPSTLEVMAGMADELSQEVFGNQPVEVHMCDPYLKTLKVVPQS
jgi:hypothetical protein